MKRVLSQIGNGILILLVILLVLLAYGSVNNRWYKVVAVEGNSMSPTFKFGDAIVLTPPTQHIPKGTIITMKVDDELVTHRLVTDYNGGWPETKGDANNVTDYFSGSDLKIVGIERFSIPWLGYPSMYFRYLLNNL